MQQASHVPKAQAGGGKGQAPEQPAKQQYLYEPQFGLPVVRTRVHYSQILKDIRTRQLKAIHWHGHRKGVWQEGLVMSGECMLEYRDGTLKQSYIPVDEPRIRYAIENHHVKNMTLPVVPPKHVMFAPKPFPFQKTVAKLLVFIPIAAFTIMWMTAQLRDLLRGDYQDRASIRMKTIREEEAEKKSQAEDSKFVGVQQLIVEGEPEQGVRNEIKRLKLDISEDELQAMIVEGRRKREREAQGKWSLAEEEAEKTQQRLQELQNEPGTGDEKDMAKMSGVKIRRAGLRTVNRERLKGRLKNVEDDDIFFRDVAGIDDAKRELTELVDFFNFPERYTTSGARAPRGVLLYGPPGTGKTLLARAVAGEANATFFGVNASEFIEMFMGVGASRMRDLFESARAAAPSVVFIDEIDAVGRQRGKTLGNDERDQTLNQMLSEMDGFDARAGVVVIAATNRRDVLDAALIRPGRFDRQVYVGAPSRLGRVEVLHVHLRNIDWDQDDVDLDEIGLATDGYTGAMLAGLINTAMLLCNRDGRSVLSHGDLVRAIDYDAHGMVNGEHLPDVARRIAIVESGIALAATLLPATERVSAVYTRPADKRRLGQTILADSEQRITSDVYTNRYLKERLQVTLAGRAAERILLGDGDVSTLSLPHLALARQIVQRLVLTSAMSEQSVIGPRTLAQASRLGDSVENEQYISRFVSREAMAAADVEMQELLTDAEANVEALLRRNRAALEAAAAALDGNDMLGSDFVALVRPLVAEVDRAALDTSDDVDFTPAAAAL